jgi:alpha-tubulin suppressor-like RCC1 family protein
LGNPDVKSELLLTPVETLRGVRVISIAAAGSRCYAVADTGEVWAWGDDRQRPSLRFVLCLRRLRRCRASKWVQ